MSISYLLLRTRLYAIFKTLPLGLERYIPKIRDNLFSCITDRRAVLAYTDVEVRVYEYEITAVVTGY